MAYNTSILDQRVEVWARQAADEGEFGVGSAGTTYVKVAEVWANVSWARGIKAMRAGAMDAYDSVMVRTRYNDLLKRDCRLKIGGTFYQIDSFNGSRRENTIQITATELSVFL